MVKDKNHHMILRNNAWYFVTKINGRRIRKALSQSVTEARRIRDEYLMDIRLHGHIQTDKTDDGPGPLFGDMAKEWVGIISKEIKLSTLTDYRYSMNRYILPRFGDTPIREINDLDIKKFVSTLTCSHKRKNNVLVPMRSVLNMAFLSKIIEENPMDHVRNLKIDKPDIYPLSMDEVRLFLDNVSPRFRDFFR